MLLNLLLLGASILAADPPPGDGMITGGVVRAADQSPVAGAEVILRARVGDQLVPVAETTADAQGRFRFEHLTADGKNLYLPGANRDGIHYPGPNVRLTSLEPQAEVTLAVHDAVAFPNPLVVRRHEIILSPQPGVLEVTESMLIDNPSSACYVGQAGGQDAEPVTLQLAIPAAFQRVTFVGEFFGRRFSLVGGKLVTSVPWPPGQRELKFSYWLPNTGRHYVWQRPLGLPTEQVRVGPRRSAGRNHLQSPRRSEPRRRRRRVRVRSPESCRPATSLTWNWGTCPSPSWLTRPGCALTLLVGLMAATCLPTIDQSVPVRSSTSNTATAKAGSSIRRVSVADRRPSSGLVAPKTPRVDRHSDVLCRTGPAGRLIGLRTNDRLSLGLRRARVPAPASNAAKPYTSPFFGSPPIIRLNRKTALMRFGPFRRLCQQLPLLDRQIAGFDVPVMVQRGSRGQPPRAPLESLAHCCSSSAPARCRTSRTRRSAFPWSDALAGSRPRTYGSDRTDRPRLRADRRRRRATRNRNVAARTATDGSPRCSR